MSYSGLCSECGGRLRWSEAVSIEADVPGWVRILLHPENCYSAWMTRTGREFEPPN